MAHADVSFSFFPRRGRLLPSFPAFSYGKQAPLELITLIRTLFPFALFFSTFHPSLFFPSLALRFLFFPPLQPPFLWPPDRKRKHGTSIWPAIGPLFFFLLCSSTPPPARCPQGSFLRPGRLSMLSLVEAPSKDRSPPRARWRFPLWRATPFAFSEATAAFFFLHKLRRTLFYIPLFFFPQRAVSLQFAQNDFWHPKANRPSSPSWQHSTESWRCFFSRLRVSSNPDGKSFFLPMGVKEGPPPQGRFRCPPEGTCP